MKIKQLILTCCSLLFILTSCNNYLDVKPKGKIIPKTAEEYSTILHYWLDEIEKGANATIIPEPDYTSLLEFFAEDLDGTLASSLVNTQLYVGSRINTNQKRYPELYSVIKDCNVIISNMEDTESEMAKNILGTAWSLRSICYYNLLQSFCEPYQPETATETLGLPLVDEFDMEAKPERSNQKETAEFILKGFRNALLYNVTDKDYLFTAQVTKAFMARFFFWTQDWENAIIYAKEVLEQYPMLEAEEYADNINQKLSKGKNVIIASYTNENDIGSLSYVVAQSNVIQRPVSKELVQLFNSSPNDIRKANSFNAQRIPIKKVTTKFRSEELCLIIAESYAHLNNTTEALKYLNLLRSKRITQDYIAYTMDNLPEVAKQNITVDATGAPLSKLISAILCERRMELFLEGDRWFELKRNGRPEFWIAANGKKYVTENKEALFKSYVPYKAQIFQADDETKANDALNALKKGDKFSDVVKKYGTTSTYDGSEKVYTNQSGLPNEVFSAMSGAGKKGLIEKVITSTNTSTSVTSYYIVNLVETEPKNYEDEAIQAIAETSTLATEATKFYFKKYDMTIYDIDAYNSLKNSDLIVQ